MKKTELIKEILKLAEELDKADGFAPVIIIDDMEKLVDKYVEQLSIPLVMSSAMYKATFSFFKENPRGGRGQWCTEIVPLESKNETDLKEKIATYLKDDHNSYHKHIKLKDI